MHQIMHFPSENLKNFSRGLRPRTPKIDIPLAWFVYNGIMHQIMHFPSENLKNFSRGLRPRTPKIFANAICTMDVINMNYSNIQNISMVRQLENGIRRVFLYDLNLDGS